MQLFAKFKKIPRRRFRATLNFRKFKVALNILRGILFTSLLNSLVVFMTLQIKTSFESANVLVIFILPAMERSLWDHIFNVFFKDPNLSKKNYYFNLFSAISCR